MNSVHGSFGARPISKRKRTFEETDNVDIDGERHFKRSNLTRLPIRTSPTLSQGQLWHNVAPAHQRPLTPVDSSDEEAHGQAENLCVRRRTSPSPFIQHTNYKIPSVTIELDVADDEMEMESLPHTSKLQNNLNLQHQFHLLSAPVISLDERVPTPITARFNPSEVSPKSRRCRALRPTMLSPTLPEETYLSSPIEPYGMYMEADSETMSRVEHTSSGFGALSMRCAGDDMMEDAEHMDDSSRSSHAKSLRGGGRNARLHMGYRADCEKCQQRVPGHYNHIIWN